MRDWNYENEQWTLLPPHLKHLPLFTRYYDFTSLVFRLLWGVWLKGLAFRLYIRLQVVGDFRELYRQHQKVIIISNHASHLDAVSITAAVPFRFWKFLFITAAKDYWFRDPIFTFFSKHCLGAIPIDRKDKRGEAIKLCTTLLENLESIWLIMFPEGTRTKDGFIQPFKRGVSLFAMRTKSPILFLYLEGNNDLWPKGRLIPFPGVLKVHVGPVVDPAPVDEIYDAYRAWVTSINPNAYRPEDLGDSDDFGEPEDEPAPPSAADELEDE
jgi:1-acyl-sn-glycerol-3-phosphate acyltransferase